MTDEWDEQAEFDEDFGWAPPEGAELDRLLDDARRAGNVPLRRLIKHHKALRSIAASLLEIVEAQKSAPDDLLVVARHMIRGSK